MHFSPVDWFSLAFSFMAQLLCFLKLKKPVSLRVLMAVLCAGNVLAVLTHGNPYLYWDTLWAGRMAAILAFLWAVADVVSLPEKASWLLRVPVLGAAALIIPYWPSNPLNGAPEMESFRLFGLSLAGFIVIVHLVFLIPAGRTVNFALCLMATVVVEATGSYAMLHYGYHPQVQMLCWWVGIVCLLAYAVRRQGDPRTFAPGAPVLQSALSAASGSVLHESLLTPLKCQAEFELRVSSGYSPSIRNPAA